MIDPQNITNFSLSHPELEERILFWLFAAGHNARSTAKGLNKFLISIDGASEPFNAVKNTNYNKLYDKLQNSGLGCWKRKIEAVEALSWSKLNLHTCSLDDLMTFKYIGPKTARCFLLHSRPGVRYAGLDTHILKHLKANGYDVPEGTPNRKNYLYLENIVLQLADKAGKTPAEFDLEIWKKYAK